MKIAQHFHVRIFSCALPALLPAAIGMLAAGNALKGVLKFFREEENVVNPIGRPAPFAVGGGIQASRPLNSRAWQSYQLPEVNLFDLPGSGRSRTDELIADLLGNIKKIRENIIQYQFGIQTEPGGDNDYGEYLQFPNRNISKLAESIVEQGDSNDDKAYKILMWVLDNIEYQSDLQSYGQDEYWAYPTMTLANRTGDCEDGAFLIHSLMLHAGIPPDRIRTYGGYVVAGEGASTGGHGWTVYKRETDDEWVVLDWSYFPNRTPVAERIPMREDPRYIDDYFYVSLLGTIETPFSNKVRYPQAVGRLVDVYA